MAEGYFLRKNSVYDTKSVGITAIQAKTGEWGQSFKET
jgi:hypothetical protein